MSTPRIGKRFTLAPAAGRKTLEKLKVWKPVCAVFLCLAVMATVSSAQTFTALADFNGTDGATPEGTVVQGIDGNFYGVAPEGGENYFGACVDGCGTVFKMSPSGTLTTLYTFCSETNCADGQNPYALVEGSDGNFYGTTAGGGSNGKGTVFELNPPSGLLTQLYSFCSQTNCADGEGPYAAMVEGTDGNLYGTTEYGGANGKGTVFTITPSGTLTTLYSFCSASGCADGESPLAPLVGATDGNFYGMTDSGGSSGYGTVFEITPSGTLTTLYSFCSASGCADGADPYDGLVEGTDGNFYGMTYEGGANNYGTVFKMTSAGTLTTLYSFCSASGCSDGANPYYGSLVEGTDGNFYGTTEDGGANNYGTAFKITPSGTLKTLYSFDQTDGYYASGLIQAVSGAFYGTTADGGASGDGTVFSLSVGRRPFVEALPYWGEVGNTVGFLGQGFTSSTTVSFNGTKSPTVKVQSGIYLTATVPSGSSTGFVTVTTSGGTLKSNQKFRVMPQVTSFDPTGGPKGTVVTIGGESFSGATSVTVGGVKATSVKVDSYTQITATVPSGAQTGKITVTTPGGSSTSAGTFTVLE